MNLGRVILRTTVGGLFLGHGVQKLFGWFDGPGIGGVEQMFGQIGLHPPRAHAIAAGVAETGGGAALILGAGTPLACSVLTSTMITAIQTVHGKNGPWNTSQGWEYNAVLIAACAAIVESGPGSPSVDGDDRSGSRWVLLMLALGAAGSAGAAAISAALTPSEVPISPDSAASASVPTA